MPAIMDDPSSPTIHRVSGAAPYPDPTKKELPPTVKPRQVMLRDRQTVATVVPFASSDQVPPSLLAYLSSQFAKEVEGGDTYPMIEPMPYEAYVKYWFQNFAAIMLIGSIDSPDQVADGKDWTKECLGSFYTKPNYPGRSSHVCNAGFLVTDAARNRGAGRLMGEAYLDWAPKLGYSYSVFNLVYETNVASCRIWDALGFKRIGRVKGCGNLKSYPDRLVDAIIYGRDLGPAAEGDADPLLVSEERFDKIKFYLKYGRYPNGSDRAEKSRLRSAATHYKLLENDVLMLKGKEVISDPIRQMTIAHQIHGEIGHAGINKTTAIIADKFHWSRIKETVSDVIRTCTQCKDLAKTSAPGVMPATTTNRRGLPPPSDSVVSSLDVVDPSQAQFPASMMNSANVEQTGRVLPLQSEHELASLADASHSYGAHNDLTSILNPVLHSPADPNLHGHDPMLEHASHHAQDQDAAAAAVAAAAAAMVPLHDGSEMFHPIDPQIISQQGPAHHVATHSSFEALHHSSLPNHSPNHHPHHTQHQHHHYQQSPHPSHSSLPASQDQHHLSHQHPHHHQYSSHHPPHSILTSHNPFDPSTHHPDGEEEDPNSFQALLNDSTDIDGHHHDMHEHHDHHHHHHHDHDVDLPDAVDRDLDMLIDHHDDDSEMDVDVDVVGVMTNANSTTNDAIPDVDEGVFGVGISLNTHDHIQDDQERGGNEVRHGDDDDDDDNNNNNNNHNDDDNDEEELLATRAADQQVLEEMELQHQYQQQQQEEQEQEQHQLVHEQEEKGEDEGNKGGYNDNDNMNDDDDDDDDDSPESISKRSSIYDVVFEPPG